MYSQVFADWKDDDCNQAGAFLSHPARMRQWHFQRCMLDGILKRCVTPTLLMACLCALKAAWHFLSGCLAVWFGFFSPSKLCWSSIRRCVSLRVLHAIASLTPPVIVTALPGKRVRQVHITSFSEGERDYIMSLKNKRCSKRLFDWLMGWQRRCVWAWFKNRRNEGKENWT